MNTNDDLIIELLAVQYIKGQHYNSAAEYVSLFRKAEEEIRAAYKSSEKPFNVKSLTT